MSEILSGLKPEAVFRHFEALSQIPRESGNEKAVSDYLVQFAKQLDLEVIQDETLNVMITKPAAPGFEKAPHVILQGHMDMVCVKEDSLSFDFSKDPIPLLIEDDFVKTRGTTLGADNGIAVAMAMSILESETLAHPKLTALFTVAEETGMDGVIGLRSQDISGDILINIDSEEEGTLLASCAGGVNNIVSLPVLYKEVVSEVGLKLKVQGLKGGHSGMEINKNRANALKVLGRVLDGIETFTGLHIVSLKGGDKMNAIAKSAELEVALENAAQLELVKERLKELEKTLQNEFETSDPDIEFAFDEVEKSGTVMVFSEETKLNTAHILRLMPYGVQTMSANIEGLVESSNNIGVLTLKADHLEFSSAVRSSVKSLKDEINNRIDHICNLTGAHMELVSDYPEWPYKVNSEIRSLMCTVWEKMYSKPMEVDAIHAGLECGLLKEKVGDIDMISLGPNLYDVHTPKERMSISSVQRVYAFLVQVLSELK